MKLKNKRTGEIGYLYEHSLLQDIIIVYDVKGIVGKYTSLAELNEEWEDYKEPKEYWYINEFGTPAKADFVGRETLYDKCRKNFGNYFETREEAEKTVEKLKALKRLKDKGFRLEGHSMLNYAPNDTYDYSPSIGFSIPELDKDEPYEYPEEIEKDLDICFGGEE